jgi:hypothetical protein
MESFFFYHIQNVKQRLFLHLKKKVKVSKIHHLQMFLLLKQEQVDCFNWQKLVHLIIKHKLN